MRRDQEGISGAPDARQVAIQPAEGDAHARDVVDPAVENLGLVPTVEHQSPDREHQSQPAARSVNPPNRLFDRRLSQRVAFVVRARLQWPGHDIACATDDLSMRGIRCHLLDGVPPESIPPVGSVVQVTLKVDGTLTVLKARVGWHVIEGRGHVVGLQFTRLQATHEALLQRVVVTGTAV
jgi:hypothetical protein